MDDIVERLRVLCVGKPATVPWPHRELHDAADEIERLRTALKAVRSFERADTEFSRAQNTGEQPRLSKAGTRYALAKSRMFHVARSVRAQPDAPSGG